MLSVVHFVLFDRTVGSISLATINLTDNKVEGLILNTSSRKMILLLMIDTKRKLKYFAHFLPSEFPKFLDLR